ncbi:2-oxoacid:acceptor oxidoreductase subunit alpha [Propionibacterium australiense]|uniref:2-oxoacid:acceptor oxidoreductase subunit alpha n=1 Tax=Propionibacterium australiense TaxID=119981 RepID=A0A383S4G6_9ACTN|nr:2-oxoacid:acceptor oxidoreductase subunit alpha [Propionibacterium australiense]RLP11953.1 2-oxoacid:acceptor oxidoreductase subunit alpha [Propionibacterium australiense]RLP12591.1 2-oxoacid:acceptor oxidoreductase subunit alpha [Propionibacterium australiense]SYZ32581.1 2-oxoacid:acceptor oxidoreductase, alpha subunit [Propionibacterium australiense]VEH91668.1 2-oxoglutarate ferredoxin oxidoreductase subunit alpha [Propionibacterium australiense]
MSVDQTSTQTKQIDRVVIRFAGDSGTGMQLAGGRFGSESAGSGNDITTFPSYPAEIRAPQGTIAGVSSFQVQFANHEVTTVGERLDVLVAMGPASLKAHAGDVRRGGLIIVDDHGFTARALTKAGYRTNPLEDGSLDAHQLVHLDMTALTSTVVQALGLGRREAERSRNMFALGLVSWLYSHPIEETIDWITRRFASQPAIRDANIAALKAGANYGETAELFTVRYEVRPAPLPKGRYRQITGNTATAYGLMVGAHRAGLQLFVGSYPITPASDLLHELSRRASYGVVTFQAEDEIAGIGAALGASFGGSLGVTTTSGPGFALKQEMINLAVMSELPLVVIDVQRAGPSTGMPTKPEQGDLLQAMWGRNGESPLPVLAPTSPADCFDVAVQACRMAIEYRTPVVMLTDAFLGNGAEPWRLPDLATIAPINPNLAAAPNGIDEKGRPVHLPYRRDPRTLARDWAVPGTPGMEHRLGGLEKSVEAGTVTYSPLNHEEMVLTRSRRIAGIPVPDAEVDDPSGRAEVLVVGWGSACGPVSAAVQRLREAGTRIAHVQLRALNPLPANLGPVLRRYARVVVPEMNLGQFATVLRARYLVDVRGYNRVRGFPLNVDELTAHLAGQIDELAGGGAASGEEGIR